MSSAGVSERSGSPSPDDAVAARALGSPLALGRPTRVVAALSYAFVVPAAAPFSVGAKVRPEFRTAVPATVGARLRLRVASRGVSELISPRVAPPSAGAQVGVTRGSTVAGVVF